MARSLAGCRVRIIGYRDDTRGEEKEEEVALEVSSPAEGAADICCCSTVRMRVCLPTPEGPCKRSDDTLRLWPLGAMLEVEPHVATAFTEATAECQASLSRSSHALFFMFLLLSLPLLLVVDWWSSPLPMLVNDPPLPLLEEEEEAKSTPNAGCTSDLALTKSAPVTMKAPGARPSFSSSSSSSGSWLFPWRRSR